MIRAFGYQVAGLGLQPRCLELPPPQHYTASCPLTATAVTCYLGSTLTFDASQARHQLEGVAGSTILLLGIGVTGCHGDLK